MITGPDGLPRGWAARMVTIEAMAALVLARLLIARVRFGRWRGWLGEVDAAEPKGAVARPLDRYLARAVERAAGRLPFETRCLPRAMALHWLRMRRGRAGTLVIGVLPGARRGGLDDLHAWVECGGEVLIGALDAPHGIVLRLGSTGETDEFQ